MAKVDELLAQFQQDSLTVKLVAAIFGAVPGGPEFQFYNSVEGGVKRHNPAAGQDIIDRARSLSAEDDASKAMWVTDALDTADAGLGIYSGIKNVFALFGKSDAPRKRTFESDPQQATDAALKAVGLAYMIYRLFPGSIGEKVSAFKNLKAGNEIATYFAVAEVALPFADNLVEGSGNLIERLMNSNAGAIKEKFASFAGSGAFDQATQVMSQLTAPLDGYLAQAKGHTGAIMDKIKGYLPGAMNMADSVTGAAATGVDLMPVWRFLGSRLVVEACAYRAERS